MSLTKRIVRLEQRAEASASDLAHLTDQQLLDQIKRLADELGYNNLPPETLAYLKQWQSADT